MSYFMTKNKMSTITGIQIRMARAALNWSAQHLSEVTQISHRTIVRMEKYIGVPQSTASNLAVIRKQFEDAGIEFIGTPDDRPGIRISGAPKA